MCIRDSTVAVGEIADVIEGEACAARPGRSREVGIDQSANPVSYTHLRAHETVLDIVCRLLLEKKKT